MRCEELRAFSPSPLAGESRGEGHALGPEAEEHVRGCEACFTWLEQRDPLIEALRAARPPEVQPSPALAGDVVTVWRSSALLPVPGRALLALASAGFLVAACAVSVVVVGALVGSRASQLAGSLGAELTSLLAPVGALGGFATGELRDHPAWLLGLGVAAAVAAWGWARIDLRLSDAMRETV